MFHVKHLTFSTIACFILYLFTFLDPLLPIGIISMAASLIPLPQFFSCFTLPAFPFLSFPLFLFCFFFLALPFLLFLFCFSLFGISRF